MSEFKLPEFDPAQFKLLSGAMLLDNEYGRGNCFHMSSALVLDLPHGDVCIGVVRGATVAERDTIPNASPTPFIHCWVEQGNWLLAPTTIAGAGGKLLGIPKDYYYERNGIDADAVKRMNRAGIMRLAKAHGWLKAIPFGNGNQIATPLGTTLLEALGVEYEISDGRGGVVPPGTVVPENEK